jgi:hypothetical protein
MLAVGANGTAIMAALPTMQAELFLSSAGVQWTVNAYLVASATWHRARRPGGGLVWRASGIDGRISAVRGSVLHYCRCRYTSYRADRTDLARLTSQAESEEKILTFDVPDEALERAASAERQAFTWVYCTNGWYWYCNWPQ